MSPLLTPLLEMDGNEHGRIALAEGERVALLGASGSGKTSLLRRLVGLDRSSASVAVHGRRAGRAELAASIGYVPETGGGVFSDLSVLDNVMRSPHLPAVPWASSVDALDLLGLAGRLQQPAGTLSVAERRRLALARAIAREVPVLIIDGDLDATLAPLLATALDFLPKVKGVLTAGCTADDWAWRADSVVLVDQQKAIFQAPLAECVQSRDPQVQSVLTWVMPTGDLGSP